MNSLSFFTPVDYGNQSRSYTESLLEFADDYFYFGGRKTVVIPGQLVDGSQPVKLADLDQPLFTTCIKVATYFTLVLPAILFALKLILRGLHAFHLVEQKSEDKTEDTTTEEKRSIEETSEIPEVDRETRLSSHLKRYICYLTELNGIHKACRWKGFNGWENHWNRYNAALDKVKQLVYPLKQPFSMQNMKDWDQVMSHFYRWEMVVCCNALEVEANKRFALQKEYGTKSVEAIYLNLAEAYYQEGLLVDSLLAIVRIEDNDSAKPFLAKLQQEKKPLVRQADGTALIGSLDKAAKAIDRTYKHQIKNTFYHLIAIDCMQQGQEAEAEKFLDRIKIPC